MLAGLGLGYRSRAGDLCMAAKDAAADRAGVFPSGHGAGDRNEDQRLCCIVASVGWSLFEMTPNFSRHCLRMRHPEVMSHAFHQHDAGAGDVFLQFLLHFVVDDR